MEEDWLMIDWDKVNDLEDVINILKGLQPVFQPNELISERIKPYLIYNDGSKYQDNGN